VSRFKDFDQAVDDLEPIRFKVNGREYVVDPDLPGLPIMQMLADGKVDLTDPSSASPTVALDLLKAILGDEQFEFMQKDRVGVRKLTAVSKWLSEQVGLNELLSAGDEAGDESGNGSRSLTSSNGGEPSKPTTGASTGSSHSGSDGDAS